MNYYNENDPKTAAWLRALITDGLIPSGHVDARSIVDVRASDLDGYVQCHFFAGIGGWPLALALAGWPESRPVWTGSCPCQPFSVAGKGKGIDDARHLWPEFARLIRARKPPICFGEQVASADGRAWLAGVFADLEAMGYHRAGADLCAAGVASPHIRQRLYWVAEPESQQHDRRRDARGGRGESTDSCRMVQPISEGLEGHARHGDNGNEPGRIREGQVGSTAATSDAGGMVLADSDGRKPGSEAAASARHRHSTNSTNFWAESCWIDCGDGYRRRVPIESALFPLASRLPYKLARRRNASTALISGSGNSIVPQVAAEFISAYLEARGLT